MVDTPEKIANIDNDKFYGNHSFLAERLNEPWVDHTNSNRGQMFASHFQQMIGITGSESPLISTGFENQTFKNSSLGYYKVPENKKLRVLNKIVKNKYNYVLIVQDINSGEYDIIKRQEGINLTEHFGLDYNNTKIDSLKVDDEIDSNEMLYHDDNYDDEGNAQYGLNLNAVYISHKGDTNEDAAVISESTAKRMGSTFVKKVSIKLNTNDIPLNLFGDETYYKSFPDIGESFTNERPFFEFRRLNYSDIVGINDNALRLQSEGDTHFITHGKIIDIDIYNNYDEDLLSEEKYSEQIYNEYKNIKRYYKEFLDAVSPLVKDKDTRDKVSTALFAEYNTIAHFNDHENIKLTYDGSKFDKLLIEFTVMYNDIMGVGSKLTNRLTNLVSILQ